MPVSRDSLSSMKTNRARCAWRISPRVGSHAINGVAQLHSELLKQTVLRDFAELWPEKFCNVTNGVTPRRFVALSNPGLTKLINARIGDGWLKDLNQLRQLEQFADDSEFQEQWRKVKLANKRRLAALIKARTGIKVAPQSLFDVQVKRIHEYKRQHLAALHIIALYLRLRRDPEANVPARTFIFGAKPHPVISWPSASSNSSMPSAKS